MNLKWLMLFSLGLFALQASAEQSVVIDAQAIDEQTDTTGADVNTTAQAETPAVSPGDANRERVLKGGKMSPKQKHELAKAALSESNQQTGNDFLAANKARQGVVSLPSGVQYKILIAGKGKKKPTEASVILCRYQGGLIDGTVFEKSDAKKPATLNVIGLLPGLKEAVKLMSTGSKWQIVVPPQLGYGDRGNRVIGPNAVLIYEMEIITIK
ncbi:MAG: FKBP-type peptidyl-prolyl cis-trans isomerase [Gallionella sp.]|jgi:FKBP-type peptidyl-prolyl cis-trans isomerase